MSEKENAAMIPYYVHEGEMNRLERVNKRWFVLFIIVLSMLFITNAGWIIYENQFADEVTTVEQEVDTGEGMAVVSGTGDAIYGESDSKGDGT